MRLTTCARTLYHYCQRVMAAFLAVWLCLATVQMTSTAAYAINSTDKGDVNSTDSHASPATAEASGDETTGDGTQTDGGSSGGDTSGGDTSGGGDTTEDDNSYTATSDAIGDTLCKIVNELTGPTGKAIANLAVIFLAMGLFNGKASWGQALAIAIGISVVFAASDVASWIAGMEVDCSPIAGTEQEGPDCSTPGMSCP